MNAVDKSLQDEGQWVSTWAASQLQDYGELPGGKGDGRDPRSAVYRRKRLKTVVSVLSVLTVAYVVGTTMAHLLSATGILVACAGFLIAAEVTMRLCRTFGERQARVERECCEREQRLEAEAKRRRDDNVFERIKSKAVYVAAPIDEAPGLAVEHVA